MVNSLEFAKRLQKILSYYGVSATAFSEEIQFNRSTISHLLSGRNKPSLDFVMKVIEKFPEVELYWLLNGKGSFPSENKKSSAPISENMQNLKEAIKFQKNVDFNPVDQTETPKKSSGIERIVIFFEDGSFKTYEN